MPNINLLRTCRCGGGGGAATSSITGTGFGSGNVGFTWSDNTDYTGEPDEADVPLGSLYAQNGNQWSNKFKVDKNIKIGSRSGSIKVLKNSTLDPVTVRTPKIYATWYQRFSCLLNDAAFFSTNNRSEKFCRFWDTSGDPHTWVSWTQMHFTVTNNDSVWADTRPAPANSWHRMEFVQDGLALECLMDGQSIHNTTFIDQEEGLDFYWAQVGYDVGTDYSLQDYYVWLAEMYRLPDQARLEVSDSATWSAGVITKYIQEVTSWTDTEIQFNLFTGDFSIGTAIYGHIIDANGSLISSHSLGDV